VTGSHRPASESPGRVRGWLLTLSGTVLAGLVVLALGLVLVWAVVGATGSPGPGPVMLAGHLVGAGLAVFLHRTARRRADAPGWAAAFGAPGVLLVLGLLFWWN
jgi:hypothetical protein